MKFPRDLANIIAGYAASMELRTWAEDAIDPYRLLANPNALGAYMPEKYAYSEIPDDLPQHLIKYVLWNPSPIAGAWVAKNVHRLVPRKHDRCLLANPGDWAGELFKIPLTCRGIELLERYLNLMTKSECQALSTNPASWAVDLLKIYPKLIDYHAICANASDFAIEYMHNGDYYSLEDLSRNAHPWAIALIKKRHNRDADLSSSNPSPDLVHFLRDNVVRTNPQHLAANPSIFKQKKKRVAAIVAELVR